MSQSAEHLPGYHKEAANKRIDAAVALLVTPLRVTAAVPVSAEAFTQLRVTPYLADVEAVCQVITSAQQKINDALLAVQQELAARREKVFIQWMQASQGPVGPDRPGYKTSSVERWEKYKAAQAQRAPSA